MGYRGRSYQAWLLGGAAALALTAGSAAAAEDAQFSIAPQPLASALNEFSIQSRQSVLFTTDLAQSRVSPGVSGEVEVADALSSLLAGTGLTWKRQGDTFLVMKADADPQSGSAAGGGAEVEALIVTAQKREEDIQDVPIAMSAFTQEALETAQIAGGPDLMTQVPNMTFTKTNFSGYSIQIRGIGTQAISATTDPAVAVGFNNSPMIRNRFFEQEFYDLNRVEVLRGPQGTLYGRNATAGVVNLLTARPTHRFEAKLSADVANYSSTRLEGMLNIPIVDDKLALRLAGAWTKREGFVTNQMTGKQVDGRDLWSTRLTLGFEPTDAISAYSTWEHFEEDDDRLRSGKQLCKKAEFPATIGGVPLPPPGPGAPANAYGSYSYLSQGCLAASMYAEDSFQTPNGYALPYYGATSSVGNPVFPDRDAYVSTVQSRDLRVIESSFEPGYRARADVVQLQLNFDLSDDVSLTSETLYSVDNVFSTQDFNRFTTAAKAFDVASLTLRPGVLTPDGIFCDPQLGCSDRLLLGDLSTAVSKQFGQEIRVSSNYAGPMNFSAGLNFVRYDTEEKYYVFANTLTMLSANLSDDDSTYVSGVTDNLACMPNRLPGDPNVLQDISGCTYIDPNPIGSLNDLGHNYFLSKNPYRLISYAAFGEIYYQLTPTLKVTGGLRYTVDKKRAPRAPSWLLVANTFGYPVSEVIELEWAKPTGRLVIDWKPDLALTDDTLLYASYARGYKAGGANPPPTTIASFGISFLGNNPQAVVDSSLLSPRTFDAEFVDAFELGAKNTLLDGRIALNGNIFYYDYRGYQISQIINRSAVSHNFDAEVWGAELEADWRPMENLKFGLKLGYEATRVADGSRAIDTIDRTAGNPDYMVLKPFPTVPSNCIVPVAWVVRNGFIQPAGDGIVGGTCVRLFYGGETLDGLDPATVPNNGEGIFKDLSGNELPNAPHVTATLSADYTVPLPNNWLATLHTDLYYQSEAWTRIINMDGYDKLKAYNNINLAAIFTNEDAGWKVMAYVKNVLDTDSITGAFLNSDDTGLTTNVFLTEPRLYGIRVTKNWSGGSLWGSSSPHEAGQPYALTLELGGGAARFDADNTRFTPAFVEASGSPILQSALDVQEEDLDWGDSREIKLTYGRPGSHWRVSAGLRRDETNGTASKLATQKNKGGRLFSPEVIAAYPQAAELDKYVQATNYVIGEARDREEAQLADFMVGRDVGLGLLDKSSINVGLRYAELSSISLVKVAGTADHEDFPDLNVAFLSPATMIHRYDISSLAEREFKGFGPAVSWDGSKVLFGGADAGYLTVDFGVGAAVLFGKQKTDVVVRSDDTPAKYNNVFLQVDEEPVVTTMSAVARSQSTTVYDLGANLGLSYEIGRMKVSGGYRIDRFYDVLDVGRGQHEDGDRTMDGPYFKIAVGFGG